MSACVEGGWGGYYDKFIWVNSGCRADFLITSRRQHRDDVDEHHGRRIVCESTGRRHRCDAEIRFGVRLMQKLGRRDCIRGETWGYARDGLWCTDGCLAVFHLARVRE